MNLTITVLGGMAFFGVLVSALVSFCTAIGVICLLWSWNYFFPSEDRMVCPCNMRRTGGYQPTEKDKAALKKFKAGQSIGFTMRSSLKAKGLIPRVNGTKRVSKKYRGTRKTHG